MASGAEDRQTETTMSDQPEHRDGVVEGASGDALAAMTAASAGLLMPSESDYPFEPFRWTGPGPLSAAALLVHLGLPPETPVEMRDAMALLDSLAAAQDWHAEEERATAARFARLRDTIAAHLADVLVYRAGSIEIALVIAGRDRSGAVVGLRTTVVET